MFRWCGAGRADAGRSRKIRAASRPTHQGLAVNDIAAEGEAAPPPDRLMLAPRPVELADEDQTRGRTGAELEVAGRAKWPPPEAEAVAAIEPRSIAAIAEALG